MRVQISVGQVFDNDSGQEWEVVRVTERTVTFETSDGDLPHMDIDDVVADFATGVLVTLDAPGDEEKERSSWAAPMRPGRDASSCSTRRGVTS